MLRKPLLIVIFVLALTTLACSFNLQLPITTINTGPSVTEEIVVPSLDDPETVAKVDLAFGAGVLKLSPGAEGNLISGTATYNVTDFKPEVTVNDNRIRISQGESNVEGIPTFSDDIENIWTLSFGKDAMDLRIIAGAYEGEMELGGLSLYSLHITDGAAQNQLNFSKLNLVDMIDLTYETGASSVTLSGLANANFREMVFKSGAGDYTLDFAGELQRDADVEISTGLSNLEIIVPSGMNARLNLDSNLTNINVGGEWEGSGSEYIHPGNGHTLTISVEIGAGNLDLRTH